MNLSPESVDRQTEKRLEPGTALSGGKRNTERRKSASAAPSSALAAGETVPDKDPLRSPPRNIITPFPGTDSPVSSDRLVGVSSEATNGCGVAAEIRSGKESFFTASSSLLEFPELSLERADEVTRPLFQPLPLKESDYGAMNDVFQRSTIHAATMNFLWQRFRDRWWHRSPPERSYLWQTMKTVAMRELPESSGLKRWHEHLCAILMDPWEDDLSLLTVFVQDTLETDWDEAALQHLWAAWSVRFTQLPCRGRSIAIRALRDMDRRFFRGALADEIVDFYKTLVVTFPAIWWREATNYDPHLEDNLIVLMGNYLFENTWHLRLADDLERVWLSCLRFGRREEQRIATDVLHFIRRRKAQEKELPSPRPRPGEHLRGTIPQDIILMSIYRQIF